jgi:hypothetical protein
LLKILLDDDAFFGAAKQGDPPVLVFRGDPPGPDIELGVSGVLDDYVGTWTIDVDRQLVGGWCQVRISTEGFDHGLLLAPSDQSSAQVSQLVREAIGSRELKRKAPS